MAPLAGHQAAHFISELHVSETLGNIHPQERIQPGRCHLVRLPLITKYHFGPGTGQVPKSVPLQY